MKKFRIFLTSIFLSIFSYGQSPYISEISYVGTTLQKIEITGLAGTDVSGWKFQFSGNNSRNVYFTLTIPSTIPPITIDNEGSGNGALSFAIPVNIRGNANSGVALIDKLGNLIPGQFISWGGSFFGKGAAGGFISTDIGITQTSSTKSLQLTGVGWIEGNPSFGTLNSNLTLSVVENQIENFAMYPNPVSNGMFYMSSSNNANKQIEIYSINGQRVCSKLVKNKEVIDIYNLNKGIYLVKIQEKGKIATRKLIVN